MQKNEAIETINSLFPVDSAYLSTRETGERLLIESIRDYDWRELPIQLLVKLAERCRDEDNRQFIRFENKYNP